MRSEAERRSAGAWASLLITVVVVGALAAVLFAPVRNAAVSPTLGARLRAPNGAPLTLDAPAPLR